MNQETPTIVVLLVRVCFWNCSFAHGEVRWILGRQLAVPSLTPRALLALGCDPLPALHLRNVPLSLGYQVLKSTLGSGRTRAVEKKEARNH